MRRSSHNRPLLLAAALAAATGLAGCAYQDPLSLPPLGSAGGGTMSTSPYYGYGGGYFDPRYGPVYSYGYDPLRRYYDPRYGYHYSGGYPSYYGPLPYPAPGHYPYPRGPYCVDANRDGRCDRRGDGDGHGNGNSNGQGNGGGQGPGLDPKRDPFEQVREIARRAERADTVPPAPASMAPDAPRQQPPPTDPKRTVESRRTTEPKRTPPASASGWKANGHDGGSSRPRRAPRDDPPRPAPETD